MVVEEIDQDSFDVRVSASEPGFAPAACHAASKSVMSSNLSSARVAVAGRSRRMRVYGGASPSERLSSTGLRISVSGVPSLPGTGSMR